MKAACIIYHKDVFNYSPKWIAKCIESLKKQTYNKVDFFELDYSNNHTQLYPKSTFASMALPTHAHAHNWLLDEVFRLGYDCAFNVNIDDHYSLDRFEKQMTWMEAGYDVVSSNFYHIDENDKVIRYMAMDSRVIEKEAKKGHNIIAHPVCCYSRNFWLNCTKLNPAEIPKDDFELWKRSYGKFKFKILPNFLLYYRVYPQKVSAEGVWKK